jgi:hypothetical protein
LSCLDLIPEHDRDFVLSTENLTSRFALGAQTVAAGSKCSMIAQNNVWRQLNVL